MYEELLLVYRIENLTKENVKLSSKSPLHVSLDCTSFSPWSLKVCRKLPLSIIVLEPPADLRCIWSDCSLASRMNAGVLETNLWLRLEEKQNSKSCLLFDILDLRDCG